MIQQERLRQAAQNYIAEDEQSAIQVARSLGYILNDGHPASVCGPLSLAILRDAGLVSKYIDLHDFWLLNPRDSRNIRILEHTFPHDEFLWFETTQSIASFDFTAFPLKAGDFLYLFAGDPGSFEHMLVVSHIDQQGRAYAVTNFNTPAGYVIEEVMLYDPAQPGIGKFYEWTDRKNSLLGLTGFGGFRLWRFQAPVADPTPLERQLADEIDQVIAQTGGNWYLILREVDGKNIYARRIREAIHPASVIKLPIAMLTMKRLEMQVGKDLESLLAQGVDGRTYAQLLRAMLVDSEEEATESLLNELRRVRFDLTSVLRSWKAETTDVIQRISSARDLAILFEGLYGNYLLPTSREVLLELLSVYTPGDDTRLGVLRQYLPAGSVFYNKRGTITRELMTASDCALVVIPAAAGKRAFIIGAYSFQGQARVSYEHLVAAMEAIANIIGKYLLLL